MIKSNVLLALIKKMIDLEIKSRSVILSKGTTHRHKPFIFQEHEPEIRSMIEEYTRVNKNLFTAEKWEPDNLFYNEITHIIAEVVRAAKDDFKLEFSDLTQDEKDSLKLCFSDLTQDEKDSLKLNFSDLSENEISLIKGEKGEKGEKGDRGSVGQRGQEGEPFYYDKYRSEIEGYLDGLRLKFSDLSENEIRSLKGDVGPIGDRGPRGQRGQKGDNGVDGESAYDIWLRQNKGSIGDFLLSLKGKDGLSIRGEIGPRGLVGKDGQEGKGGQNGNDGQDAPKITDVEIKASGSKFYFVFSFDDGSTIESNDLKIPTTTYGPMQSYGGDGGGGGGGGGGTDGKSAYQIAVDNGFVGTEDEWLESLKASIEFFNESISLGKKSKVDFVGPGVDAQVVGDKIVVTINNTGSGSCGEIINDLPCVSDVYVGSFVRLLKGAEVEKVMADWPTLSDIITLDAKSYSTLCVNAIATSWDHSNVLGLVESKPTPTTCNVRISGKSGNIFFGLDTDQEYCLSDLDHGGITILANGPSGSGHILLSLGQAFSETSFIINKNDRIIRA